jgi:hypothetical protein
MIFTFVSTSNRDAWIISKNTFGMSGEVAFFTVIEPMVLDLFFLHKLNNNILYNLLQLRM